MDCLIASIESGGGFVLPNRSSLVHLFVNDYYPDLATTAGDFDDCFAPGLVAQPLSAAIDQGVDGNGRDIRLFATMNFRAAAGTFPVIAYGYWVDCISPLTGLRTLLWYQRWDVPFGWYAVGQNYPLNLTLGGNQC
jgi:hypothetical protein